MADQVVTGYLNCIPDKELRSLFKEEKKEEIRLSPMTKVPPPTEKSETQRENTKRHQKLRLHNDCGPTKDDQLE